MGAQRITDKTAKRKNDIEGEKSLKLFLRNRFDKPNNNAVRIAKITPINWSISYEIEFGVGSPSPRLRRINFNKSIVQD